MRRAYITGGASGIGLELARQLAAQGVAVAIFDRQDSAAALAGLATAAGSGPVPRGYSLDVTDAATVEQAFGRAVEDIGRPDLVIISAGIVSARPFTEISTEEFVRVITVNLIGSRNVAAAAVPLLGQGGQLALVASLAGLVGTYGYSAYASSKFGVVGLAEVLRMELALRGIEVSVICPPEVETPMVVQERSFRPEATAAFKQLAGTLSADSAARLILAGLWRRRFLIIPGWRGRLALTLTRLAPRWLTHRFALSILRRHGAPNGAAPGA